MGAEEARNKKLEELDGKFQELAGVDRSRLSRRSDLSHDINFEKVVPAFEAMLDACAELASRDLMRLPLGQINACITACNVIEIQLKSVDSFDLKTGDPGPTSQRIMDTVESKYDEVMTNLLLPLAFTATQDKDYAKMRREVAEFHSGIGKQATEFDEMVAKKGKEVDDFMKGFREKAAELGVTGNAMIFSEHANKHGKRASVWLIFTVLAVVVTLAVALTMLNYSKSPLPEGVDPIQYIIAKLIVLSTLSFAVFWCSRNYRSEKHNETLNMHRANALTTFEAFVAGTGDERVKDAVLLQAAQAAFTNRPTGFGAPGQEQSINPVVEILGKMPPNSEP